METSLTRQQKFEYSLRLVYEAEGYFELAAGIVENKPVNKVLCGRAFATIDKITDNPLIKDLILKRILESVFK